MALPTGDVFSRWDGVDHGPLDDWREGRNDLEGPAIALVPQIETVLAWLSVQPGAEWVRMSGSGATCFALFDSEAMRDSGRPIGCRVNGGAGDRLALNGAVMPGRPILTAAAMRAAEEAAIAAGTSVEQLMERAGGALAEAVYRFAGPLRTLILVGPGNNGGDGYIAARCLAERGMRRADCGVKRATNRSRAVGALALDGARRAAFRKHETRTAGH